MQKATDIDNASAGLTVKREVIGASGNATQLKVGDRVKVRITITADRDYDFVQLIDKRAACMEPIGQLSGYHWGYYCTVIIPPIITLTFFQKANIRWKLNTM